MEDVYWRTQNRISHWLETESRSFDPSEPHYDPKSRAGEPTWYMVDIKFEKAFAELVSLDDMKEVKSLAEMEVLRRGSRLSVQPVRKHEFETVLKLAEQKQKKPS